MATTPLDVQFWSSAQSGLTQNADEKNVRFVADAASAFPRRAVALYKNTGSVDARTTTTETIALASRGKLVTLSNASAIAVTLTSTVPNDFFCFVAAIGAGTATLTPSTGQIRLLNGALSASAALTSGQWGVLFFDGTNWELEAGGTGGGGGGSGLNGAVVQTADYVLLSGDNGKLEVMNSSAAHQFTLPNPPPSTTWCIFLTSIGTGLTTINRNGLNIDGVAANLTLTQFSGIFISTDGSNYFTNGAGIGGDLTPITATSQEVTGILNKAIDGSAPTDGQILQYSNSTGKWELVVDRPIIIASAVPGKPASSQLVAIYTAFGSMTFPANFATPNSYGTVGTNPSATATYVVTKISGGTTTTVGTIVVATSGVFTFATTGGASFNLNANDRLTITAPGSQDATMSDVSITLVGTRTATVPSVLGQGIFIWRGVYSGATAYNINDVVSYVSGGVTSSFICILGTTGNVPTNATFWSEVAGGANGTNGSTWYNGSGAPSGGLGVNGDYYLDTVGNTIYFKSSGSWSSIGVLSGATVAGVQAESYTYIADTGAANAYVATLSPPLGSYAAGVDVAFKAANANTGASTLNVNSLGAKTIKKYSSGAQVDLAANDIVAGQIVRCKYDGTNFQASLGGGSSSTPVSGQPVIQGTGAPLGSDNSFGNFTVFVRIDAHALLCLPTSWKIAVGVASGANATVGNAKILKTAAGSTTVLTSTTVQWGGSSTPTLTAATISLSDAISLTLDYTHDWWVAIFFTNATNPNLYKFPTCAGANNGYISTDHTGDSTIPSTTADANIMLAYVVVT